MPLVPAGSRPIFTVGFNTYKEGTHYIFRWQPAQYLMEDLFPDMTVRNIEDRLKERQVIKPYHVSDSEAHELMVKFHSETDAEHFMLCLNSYLQTKYALMETALNY